MFEKILIANRGEIALRIQRACREMGIKTVAVHSTVDENAMHVRLADESVCIGPPSSKNSYLNIPAIITAATITNTEAIHPGYGFLSENASFAEIVEEHGFRFIGPSFDHISLMGDKIASKLKAEELGLPVVPGSKGPINDIKLAKKTAEEIGFPVIVKASAGGGGRGMKIVREEKELENSLVQARRESLSAFGNDSVYIEKLLEGPRHIEFQILGDNFGHLIHLGERDCSVQRRHQKLIEEAGCTVIKPGLRNKIGTQVCKALSQLGYRNAGTVEFLFDGSEFYFIEMNTRLQVEHPVTELVTGIDIVQEQIKIAYGLPLSFNQKDIMFKGHSIECRINAENPNNFSPSPGRVTDYHTPGGYGIRVDSALYSGYDVLPYYDSLISKLIVHGNDRKECLLRLERALDEYVIGGIESTIPIQKEIIKESSFINGDYNIHWLERFLKNRTKISE